MIRLSLIASLLTLVAPALAQDVPATGSLYAGALASDLVEGDLRKADFDADGLVDAALVTVNDVVLFRNLGDGTLEGTTYTYLGPASPRGAEAIDWNGDGHLDLSVLRTNGVRTILWDGAFQPLGEILVTASGNSLHMTAGDMDGDGQGDFVIGRSNPDSVLVQRGDGAGGVAGEISSTSVGSVRYPHTADLDLDGDLDVAATTLDGVQGELTTFANDGAGALTITGVHPYPDFAIHLASGDLDGDGAPEIAAGADGIAQVLVFPNDGAGTLGTPLTFDTLAVSDVELEDMDGDGLRDLVVANWNHDQLLLWRGDGAGGLTPADPVTETNWVRTFEVLPLDGDGLPDVVISRGGTQGVAIGLGVGTGEVRGPWVSDDLGFTEGLAVGDLDGDGRPEAVACDTTGARFWVLQGTGVERFGAGVSTPVAGEPSDVAVGDVTADGLPDVLVSLFEFGGGVELHANDGAGGLLPSVFHPTGDNVTAVHLADIDEEGSLDVLTLDRASGQLSLLLADGVGGLGAPDSWPVAFQPVDLDTGDLDGDTIPDVAVVSDGATEMTVLLGRGGGSGDLDIGTPHVVGISNYALGLGDLDLDGDLDVAVVNAVVSRMKTHLNDGSALFTADENVPSVQNANHLLVLDVDGDGVPDVVTSGSRFVGVHRGRELGGYWPVEAYEKSLGNPTSTGGLLAVDLEGSGFPDLVASSYSGRISVLPHQGSPWWRMDGGEEGGPVLSPLGSLTPGSALTLEAWNGPAGGTLWLVLGLTVADLPFAGGTLVPTPDVLLPLPLDGQGELLLPLVWPTDVPPGVPFWLQPWLASPHTAGDALVGVTR